MQEKESRILTKLAVDTEKSNRKDRLKGLLLVSGGQAVRGI